MTTTVPRPSPTPGPGPLPGLSRDLRAHTINRPTLAGIAVGCIVVTFLLFQVTPMQGQADGLVVAALMFLVVTSVASYAVEGARRARDRVLTLFVGTCFFLAMVPLLSVLIYTIDQGTTRFSFGFLDTTMKDIPIFKPGGGYPGGGAYHAIIGTVEEVLLAAVVAVPIGLLVAIYTTEYGRGLLRTAVTFFVDVMTGVPSIVAGLFVFSFWVLALHQGFSGFAAALSLAILMLPIVVRSTEEMIRLVPASLREASYALGVPKWKTILKVVMPTAAPGIVTGVMLAVARVIGETAPIILTAGATSFENRNPFNGQQETLSTYIFSGATSSSTFNVQRAWAAALTLILLVLVLNLTARLVTRRSGAGRR